MGIGRRKLLAVGAAALALPARADTFPSKQIRWVIPFAPGGNYDVTSRLVAEPMGRTLGQSVLIDNRPGAGGVVGLEAAVNAPADGYTIVMASFTVGYVAPIFAGKQQMLQLLAPVSILTTAPTLIVTRSDSRWDRLWTWVAVLTPLMPVFGAAFGWIFTETGRQPWLVFGMMTTATGVSPSVSAAEVLTSMTVFTLLYGALAVVEIKLFLYYVRKGAEEFVEPIPPDQTDDDAPLVFAY